jgi:fatty acid synthase subunit beta
LQGPVAAKWSVKKDEPIKELLGGINQGLIDRLLERSYGGDKSKIPIIDYLGSEPFPVSIPTSVARSEAEGQVTLTVNKPLPEASAWLQTLAGLQLNWLRALIASPTIVQGSAFVDNPMARLLAPRQGQKVVISSKGGVPTSVAVFGAARSYGSHKSDFKAVEITYSSESSLINLTLYEDRRDSSIPLQLQFAYKPELASMPIHEIAEGRNNRIKDFYWKLWYGDNEVMPKIDIRQRFSGPEVTIESKDIETFCDVVGNQGESFKTVRRDGVQAPMDFAIVTGWQAIMQSIFPAAIDGDLLKLVHLSNGFKVVPGATPLRAGDVCKAEAEIISVINTDAGKAVKVKGQVYRDGKPMIEVVSSFLYRGRFTDYENTFEVSEAPEYEVKLENPAAVAVLQSKEWFDWEDESSPLQAPISLTFRVESQVTFKDKSSYRDVAVFGSIYTRNHLKQLVQVGSVHFHQEGCLGNPVLAYLQRHGTAQGVMTAFANDGYSLKPESGAESFAAPTTNEPYSKTSGDFNPIHVNPYFADYVALPATITHGMWSSAATRRYVENVVAQGHPDRVLS